MHIAAYKAACEIWDLDHLAKEMVKSVAGHIEFPATWTDARILRLALDSSVRYEAARLALQRAVDGGYLTVDNRRGHSGIIRLNLLRLGVKTTSNGYRKPRETWFKTTSNGELEESLDNNRSGARRAATQGRAGAPGENPTAALVAHGDGCPCRGTGWVDHPEDRKQVIPCPGPEPRAIAAALDQWRRPDPEQPT